MAVQAQKQTNICINEARRLVFFEGEELCFNYKTNQWTEIPAYDGLAMYSLRGSEGINSIIGLVRYNGNVVHLDRQRLSDVAQDATLTTAATDPNQGGRTYFNGVRPNVSGGTYEVRVGTQDYIGDSVTWSASKSINSRTRKADFRKEGRYGRVEVKITGGFDAAVGVDIEFEGVGQV